MGRSLGDAWDSGSPYQRYGGRWSRRAAPRFVEWLQPASRQAWADVGCGTGALAAVVLDTCDPRAVFGVDASADFVAHARRLLDDRRVQLEVGDAMQLPWAGHSVDLAISGLVLNFVADQERLIREMARVPRPGGTVALYVWDYADGMQVIRYFWDAANAVVPDSRALDEAVRFPICRPEPLQSLMERSGLQSVAVRAIEIETPFSSFDDLWTPFLGKTGPAPAFLASLSADQQEAIRRHIESRLAPAPDGRIELRARAWAARGVAA